jgi:DNA primase
MFLEAGFNVKVVLLPDGEDPDSYAQSHDSTEFIRYIEQNQTDFIRFKSALLSKEAGDDPFKRAELIKDITASIAIIPDMITRQVYIKDCAERLHMSEKVLTTEVVKIRRTKAEEREKAEKQTETTIVNQSVSPQNGPSAKRSVSQTIQPRSGLEANYYNLMQLVVRYGELPIEVEGAMYTIGEVIILSLQGDEIAPPVAVYQTMQDEFMQHYKDEGFKAEAFFTFHPDPAVSSVAIDMIADKYQFVKPENDVKLGELVTQLLYEIKLTVVNMQIDDLENRLKQAEASGDVNTQLQLLKHQPELLAARNDLCKILGNRVINI